MSLDLFNSERLTCKGFPYFLAPLSFFREGKGDQPDPCPALLIAGLLDSGEGGAIGGNFRAGELGLLGTEEAL